MGRIDIVRYLISTGNVNIENVDIGGETPLFKVINEICPYHLGWAKSCKNEVKDALRLQILGRQK